MKCINRFFNITLCIILLSGSLCACGSKDYSFAYDRNRNNSSFTVTAGMKGQNSEAFASDLCVTVDDVVEGTTVDMSQATAAGLFDIKDGEVLYAKNVHAKLNPASLTKVLTALCALENGNLDDYCSKFLIFFVKERTVLYELLSSFSVAVITSVILFRPSSVEL